MMMMMMMMMIMIIIIAVIIIIIIDVFIIIIITIIITISGIMHYYNNFNVTSNMISTLNCTSTNIRAHSHQSNVCDKNSMRFSGKYGSF